MPDNTESRHFFPVPADAAGMRIDVCVSRLMPGLSRARVQALLAAGMVTAGDKRVKSSYRVRQDETIGVVIPPPTPAEAAPEAIPLDILHRDRDIIVVNKPPGMAVHPGAGRGGGTLVNALLYADPHLAGIGGRIRPGIVHRLDKDTSGLVVAARNETAMASLSAQFKNRSVHKVYIAIVAGRPDPTRGRIETLIARSRVDRKKMAVSKTTGRFAATRYETMEDLGQAALVRVFPETGRTHQIRVHMAHMGHPVAGDALYGNRLSSRLSTRAPRQMLHASKISFRHPGTDETVEFEAPLPQDMLLCLDGLRRENQLSSSGPP